MKSFSTNKFYLGGEVHNDENNRRPYTKYPIGYHSNGVKAFSKKDSWRKKRIIWKVWKAKETFKNKIVWKEGLLKELLSQPL